jgi:hypothetical protein
MNSPLPFDRWLAGEYAKLPVRPAPPVPLPVPEFPFVWFGGVPFSGPVLLDEAPDRFARLPRHKVVNRGVDQGIEPGAANRRVIVPKSRIVTVAYGRPERGISCESTFSFELGSETPRHDMLDT